MMSSGRICVRLLCGLLLLASPAWCSSTGSALSRRAGLPGSTGVQPASQTLGRGQSRTLQDTISCPIDSVTYDTLFAPAGKMFVKVMDRFGKFPIRYPTSLELHELLFGADVTDIFKSFTKHHGFINKQFSARYIYSHFTGHAYQWVVELLGSEPRFMLEVGSFLGNSAVLIAKEMQKQENYKKGTVEDKPLLMCIDTWLGAGNSWFDPSLRELMQIRAGVPHIYEQFMQHVIDDNVTDVVVPWRVSATVAARSIGNMKFIIDAIYLDSAHECGETLLELNLYFAILRPGGVLLGDDMSNEAVSHDVHLFVKLNPGLQLLTSPDRKTWAIKKPANE